MKSTKALPGLVCVGAELVGAENSWGVPGLGPIRGEGAELLMMLKITLKYKKSEKKNIIWWGELIMSHFPSLFIFFFL